MKFFKSILIVILILFPAIFYAQKTEHFIDYWDDEQTIKREEGYLINGKKTGFWLKCNYSGDTLLFGKYINDKKKW